ncbi:MAG TPA: acetoacetate decarboxylase family protein [Chloroflexota bacterium]|nr:acetoacetate decarboxylase family protein [Chloroflexota bacterium]
MPYKLDPRTMYMMPTHFGPMAGPRQGADGRMGAFAQDNRKSRTVKVSFLSDAAQLEALLPERFELVGDPVVTVAETFMTEIDWLAGRGYNVLGVTVNARYNGRRDTAVGPFMFVLWENLADPILTGREQLGFSKIYCELPEPVVHSGEVHCTASWLGFRFMDLKVTDMEEIDVGAVSSPDSPDGDELRGTLHYKYMPRTGEWGAADITQAILSPRHAPLNPSTAAWRGKGSVEFHPARWEDLPTQFMVVNALSKLTVRETLSGAVTHDVGGRNLIDQRILE